MEFDVNLGRPGRRRDEETPMRLLVVGDFSAASVSPRQPLASRPTLRVDVDSLDRVMAKLAPKLALPVGEISFIRIDDFHPDHLAARLELFKALREKRANPPASNEDVARLLGQAPGAGESPPAAPPATALDALIRNIVAPHIVPDKSAENKAYEAGVDASLGDAMRALLHAPPFQSLEAAWRGVQWLTSNLELDESLQLHLLDVTREELLADIVGAQGTARSSIAGVTSPAARVGPPLSRCSTSDPRAPTSVCWRHWG
jgi:hypothetical protein